MREAVEDTDANYGLLETSVESLLHLITKTREYAQSLLKGVVEDRTELRRRADVALRGMKEGG
jgi:hypothetical protein